MPRNKERKVAAHVQAAISAQPKMVGAAVSGQPVAAHVRAGTAAAAQPKINVARAVLPSTGKRKGVNRLSGNGTIQRASQTIYGPTDIDLSDLEAYAGDYGLHIIKSKGDKFIGAQSGNKITYPHIHVHSNGTIAISVGKGKNFNIGKNDVVPYDSLFYGMGRVEDWGDGRLEKMLRWFLMASN